MAITPDGQAVSLAVGVFEPIVPAHSTWLVVYHSADGGVTWDECLDVTFSASFDGGVTFGAPQRVSSLKPSLT